MMEKLGIAENELVPVYVTSAGERVVYGTELHKALSVKSNYTTWAERRLGECDAVEGMDFQTSKHAERHALLTSCLPSGTNNT